MIHVGDKVKITDIGYVYDTYTGFLDYYRDCGSSATVEHVCSHYVYGRVPPDEDENNRVFTVMFVREHGSEAGRKLAIINDSVNTYIINVNGLTLVSSDLPFAEGDKVFIKDAGPIYDMWDSLIKNMATVIPDGEEVYRKWTGIRSPTAEEKDGNSPESVFTVKWIGRHIPRPDEDILAIISNGTHSYIISTGGLAKAGDGSWNKYVIYVRNWAVVNKDNAQSVRDATGPKPYAEWLKNKS